MNMVQYDLAVLGSGPGGYVAAIRAAQLGMRVALIEKENLGGVCLNWGCIPTKSLIKSAEVFTLVKGSIQYGVFADQISFDMRLALERSREVVSKLTGGIKSLLDAHKVDIIKGYGKVSGPKKIDVSLISGEKKTISAANLILATGSRPKSIKGFEFDGKNIWSYKDAVLANSIPKSIIVVGGGAIGVEFAYTYNALGSKVTLLEASSRILGQEDQEVSDFISKTLQKQGIKIFTDIALNGFSNGPDGPKVAFLKKDVEQFITGEKILVAIGVVPNTESIGLENTSVKMLSNGAVETDGFTRTSQEGIFAIGDITKGPWVAHKASAEALVCVNTIAEIPTTPIDLANIPSCVYLNPQVASVGLSEKSALNIGYDVRVGRCPFHASGKAMVSGNAEGFIKSIFDKKSGELLGVHMVGSNVSELIHSTVLAKKLETTESELLSAVFPHPTFSEALQESVGQAFGLSVHV